MAKRFRFKNLIFALILILTGCFHQLYIYSFYSSGTYMKTELQTANLDVAIENFMVGEIELEEFENENLIDCILKINSSCVFLFTLKNKSGSAIDYILDLQISWEEELPEAGKLLIFPSDKSDASIYESIENGDFTEAVISNNVLDNKEITGSAGSLTGISETVDTDVLLSHGDINSSKEYSFKLFFYMDSDIISNIESFENKAVEVGISVRADLQGRRTGWAMNLHRFFRAMSSINITPPIITDLAGPKTFFISQTDGLDLRAYANAYDETEGDITHKIEISSFPAFDIDKAGTYKITYNVQNSNRVHAVPVQITIVIWDFVKITSGYYHTLALTSHGKVYTWGYNAYGQLGDGTIVDKATPQLVPELDDIIDVAAGVGCSFALTADGQAYSWGRNENGRLGDNTVVGKNKPVKVLQPDGLSFTQISCRFATAGAVTAEGDVYTWGYGGYGAAGTGRVDDNYKPTKINLSNIAALELGYYNGAAVTKDGKVYSWGSNTYGQLGNNSSSQPGPTDPSLIPYFTVENVKIKQISVGYYHMSAVSEDGRLFTWGYGLEGRLGNGTTSNKYVPQLISLSSQAVKTIAGYFHTGVITTDGKAFFFGQNLYGKHGDGTAINNLTPKVLSVNNITDISLAYDSSFVLSAATTVYGMGYGGTGVLGTGNNNNSTVPIKWVFTPPNPH